MMNKDYEIIISSLPDRADVVVEIWIGDNQFAELQQVEGLAVEIYSRPDGEPWTFEYERLMQIMSEAKTKLLG